ncbi:nitrite reductase small subunit NirD [Sorangium atrum]|uniref:Nitrite reductase small subunit NirD n=1 Tax=Sorangium atrum TaxID=2995308 RepID=A0ABT5C230_9BACT|nr:nitrite reductase small subunit NirD [Sorangium aterium]MDC0679236.1 nitrite reductase small subunit NirD [Sorangium aterium]
MSELHTSEAPRSETMTQGWIDVCGVEDIIPNTGVCALVGKRQIALVRVGEGEEVYAISNFDPFSKAFVLSRGIVGDKGGVPKIASPIYKQSFDLRSGQCLDDPGVSIPVYPIRVRAGRVEIQAAAEPLAAAS